MDRYDGKLVKNVGGLETAMIHLMPKRTDAEVYFQEKMDVTELLRFCEEHPETHLTLFSAIITALAKMFTLRPRFNRFIQGQRLYERKEITLSFICKTKFEDDSPESLIVVKALPEDTAATLGERMASEIRKKRAGEVSGSDNSVNRLAKIPFVLRALLFLILRLLDYFGADLSKLTSTDPNYSSVLVSNLGSIELPVMYHHLNNYGTTSCVVTLGKVHKEEIVMENGEKAMRDIVEIGATVDERIADGFYFAKSVKLLRKVISRPELLFRPLSEEVG
ncbi:MAG: 2-oxo acid dehydrogenase subunit E2 [Eubacteriales bacterium]|nr:2-oxo acid dehydrogenase subunit E2 [Eubacteriales bacterium]